jgi:hypothetical protein
MFHSSDERYSFELTWIQNVHFEIYDEECEICFHATGKQIIELAQD